MRLGMDIAAFVGGRATASGLLRPILLLTLCLLTLLASNFPGSPLWA